MIATQLFFYQNNKENIIYNIGATRWDIFSNFGSHMASFVVTDFFIASIAGSTFWGGDFNVVLEGSRRRMLKKQ